MNNDNNEIYFSKDIKELVGTEYGDIEKHSKFMKLALNEAKKALDEGEVPVGCVIVHNDIVIAAGSNKTNIKKNATRHAEIEALDSIYLSENASKFGGDKLLSDCKLYVTVEPCIMCAAVLQLAKINIVYFGCYNDKFGGNGSILPVHSIDCFERGHPYNCVSGVMKDQAIHLLQKFYFQENKKAPVPNKRKRIDPDQMINNQDNSSIDQPIDK
ncbi:adenosine deaminase [Heterostelium album PN500]|uniref:Adenosine deaminase n=1 Tax=Heterostelium pallidum (strain ATCC 26659 / Pp 5 / PN500) TaxID=670386 RepID=D3BQ53_HETP5|nr:adenosine deaminase [Heterostelium album PN500]EFA76273.1 adenosine deaminase [Heterostelium album PN500]|eukprot:XP_020428405.1 adenosine deaminase [Heterostelium album PN500]